MEFIALEVAETPYLYAEGTSAMDPNAVSAAMGEAFGKVMGFVTEQGIAPAGAPMAVYYGYDPGTLQFRAGLPVAAGDTDKAAGEIKAGVTPAGTVVSFTHVGPYRTLRDSYEKLMAHVEKEGLKLAAPTWEVYVDDPGEVDEAVLRTEVFSLLDQTSD